MWYKRGWQKFYSLWPRIKERHMFMRNIPCPGKLGANLLAPCQNIDSSNYKSEIPTSKSQSRKRGILIFSISSLFNLCYWVTTRLNLRFVSSFWIWTLPALGITILNMLRGMAQWQSLRRRISRFDITPYSVNNKYEWTCCTVVLGGNTNYFSGFQ